jgi:hypothetical protein
MGSLSEGTMKVIAEKGEFNADGKIPRFKSSLTAFQFSPACTPKKK